MMMTRDKIIMYYNNEVLGIIKNSPSLGINLYVLS